jgi:hypothetical protein
MYISCKFKHCQGNGKIEIEESKLAWFAKKGFQPPNTCDSCKRWKDSVSSQSVGCSKCGRNPRTFEPKQIIGANMLGDKSWSQVRSSYICTDCYRAEKKRLEPKVNIKCNFAHCLSPRGFFEMGQGEIDFLREKDLTTPNSCKPCREWKKSITDQRIQCGTCRTNVDVAAKTIIYQQQNGDVNWQQFQRNFTCKDCKKLEGAIKLTCSNAFCHQEKFGNPRTKEFLISKSEQEFYKSISKPLPKTCKPCRDFKKSLGDQNIVCSVCRRDQPVEAYEITMHCNVNLVPWDNCKHTFECSGCRGSDGRGWSPEKEEWGKDKEYGGVKYRFKTVNGKITDHMYSNPNFDKKQAHAQHIHIWKMQDTAGLGAGFSFDADSSPPPESFFKIIASFGLYSNDFELVKEGKTSKYKLSIKRLWHIYGTTTNYVAKERFNIGFQIATAIIDSWRK